MSNISNSINERIKLHKIYNKNSDCIDAIQKEITTQFDSECVYNSDYYSITISSKDAIDVDKIKNIINNVLRNITEYQYPELLYSIGYINSYNIIIWL